eukprot:3566331-Rhodomonas_salina.1
MVNVMTMRMRMLMLVVVVVVSGVGQALLDLDAERRMIAELDEEIEQRERELEAKVEVRSHTRHVSSLSPALPLHSRAACRVSRGCPSSPHAARPLAAACGAEDRAPALLRCADFALALAN